MKKRLLTGILAVCMAVSTMSVFAGCSKKEQPKEEVTEQTSEGETKEVVDMRGITVKVPTDPQRVAIFDKGFIVQNMVAMGIQDKIVASGGLVTGKESDEERDSIYLFNKIKELPNIGYPTDAVDFEAIAMVKPDLILLRNSEYIKDSEITKDAISKIENDLKIPLVVINGPGCYENVELEKHYEGIELLGKVFDKEERATEIVSLMKEQMDIISKRTAGISDAEKPSVMYIGLRNDDGVGVVWGSNFGDAKFSEKYANIKNAYSEHLRMQMSAEQIITLNPDVMILCTNSVRPNPDILTTEPAYEPLRDIKAIKDGRIASLGLLTWWGDFRLEFPTILMISAKAAYPDKFEDVNVGQWLNDYHKKLYGLDDEGAQKLKEIQQLDWMDGRNF